MAPGWATYSAQSHGENRDAAQTCEVSTKSGTSMAAPTAAGWSQLPRFPLGAAALITQYFKDENFWASFCDKNISTACRNGAFQPTGYLLKALLLHSGTPITTLPGLLPLM
jgi:hypothetical protein